MNQFLRRRPRVGAPATGQIIAGAAIAFALLLAAPTAIAQPQPAAQADPPPIYDWWAQQKISGAVSEKCRTQKVVDVIKWLKYEISRDEWQIVELKRVAELHQEILTTKENAGESTDGTKSAQKVAWNYISIYTKRITQERSDLKKLEGLPPCTEPKTAAQPPPGTPGGFGRLPPCGDVSAEIKKVTEEVTRLSKEETGQKATLAKHTGEYNVAVREYGSPHGFPDPRVDGAHTVMEADQKQLDDTRAKLKSYKTRLVALYGVPSCTKTPPTAAAPAPAAPPPGPNQVCRTPADDARYVELDSEMQRLNGEHDKVYRAATNPAGQEALRDLNQKLEDLQRQKDQIKARQPCPPNPKAADVPPPNEHGMAPTMPGIPGFNIGIGGSRGRPDDKIDERRR